MDSCYTDVTQPVWAHLGPRQASEPPLRFTRDCREETDARGLSCLQGITRDLSNPGVNYSRAASFKNVPGKLNMKAPRDSSPSPTECRNQEPSPLQKLVEDGPEAGPGMDQIMLNKAMLRYHNEGAH